LWILSVNVKKYHNGLVTLGKNQENMPWDYSSSLPIKGGHPLLIQQQHMKEESKKQEQHSKT
jgi:hypothetical protein